MNILFITSSRIGDAVLSSGLLNYMVQTYPDCKVTIACGPLATSLFEGFPNLEEIIPLKKQSYNRHWIGLWKQTVTKRWDMVIDLRDSAVSRLVFAKRKHIGGSHIPKDMHKVQQCAAIMDLEDVPSPKLWFSDDQQKKAKSLIPEGSAVLGVGPTANWAGKTWPAERFIEIVEFLTQSGGFMEGARVAVFAAPGEEEAAEQVLSSVAEDKALNIIAKTDPGTAAATIARCDFYVGNDSGLMHCAAASGVSTIGVFGPSYPHIYAPWGDHTAYARTPETFDELINYEGYSHGTCGSLMTSLTVDAVKKTITDFVEARKTAAA